MSVIGTAFTDGLNDEAKDENRLCSGTRTYLGIGQIVSDPGKHFRYYINIFSLDFLSELNKTYEKRAEQDLRPESSTPVNPPPPPASQQLSGQDLFSTSLEKTEQEEGEEFQEDQGFKMPENFDIPQDYIQLIVPKRSKGKMSPSLAIQGTVLRVPTVCHSDSSR